jgi:hypothetical protein
MRFEETAETGEHKKGAPMDPANRWRLAFIKGCIRNISVVIMQTVEYRKARICNGVDVLIRNSTCICPSRDRGYQADSNTC